MPANDQGRAGGYRTRWLENVAPKKTRLRGMRSTMPTQGERSEKKKDEGKAWENRARRPRWGSGSSTQFRREIEALLMLFKLSFISFMVWFARLGSGKVSKVGIDWERVSLEWEYPRTVGKQPIDSVSFDSFVTMPLVVLLDPMSGEFYYRASTAVVELDWFMLWRASAKARFGLALSGPIHHPLIIAKLNKARREKVL